MKKLSVAITALMLSALMLASCAPKQDVSSQTQSSVPQSTSQETVQTPKTTFKIASLKGPTTMGVVKMMEDAEKGEARHNYEFNMYGAADEITPQLVKGDIDVAIVPANLASVLYNQTQGEIVTAGINNLGVLYMISSSDEVKTIADLKGKTIYTTGKGTTPEYILNYILDKNGLVVGTDVNVEYKSEATEVASMLNVSGENSIAMLPQPYVTTYLMQNEGFKVVLDMNKEWEAVSPDSAIVTGVLVARKAFIDENKAAFDEFLQDYEKSCAYTNENIEAASQLVVKYEIVPKAPIAQKAIPMCNIAYIGGDEMKSMINGYLEVLFNQNPKSVGGKLPDDAFYYMPQK